MDNLFSSIISHSLPGLRIIDAQQLGTRTHALTLSDRRRVVLRLGDVAPEEAALRKLAAEIDLPVPELLGSDVRGSVGGQPWLLRSYLEGTPLPVAIDALDEQARYTLGRRLGEIMIRVHNLACDHFGVLVGTDPHATTRDDLSYISLRAEAAIRRAERMQMLPEVDADLSGDEADAITDDEGPEVADVVDVETVERDEPLLSSDLAAALRAWFSQQYDPSGRKPGLVHGDLRPEHILVRERRQREGGSRLQISGVLGWEYALGWAPAWDHACLLEAADDSAYFGFRVGYGESYDESTQRAAEQVREYALLPYRLVMHLEDLATAQDRAIQQRHLRILAALLRLSAKMREESEE